MIRSLSQRTHKLLAGAWLLHYTCRLAGHGPQQVRQIDALVTGPFEREFARPRFASYMISKEMIP